MQKLLKPEKPRSDVSRSGETVHTDEINPCGHDSHLTCVNFVNGHGTLEILVGLTPRSVLLVWFKGG